MRRVWAAPLLALALAGCASNDRLQAAERGVLDLRSWNVDAGPVALRGDWQLFWQRAPDGEPDGYLPAQTWRGAQLADGRTLPGRGYATYRLKVLVPTAWALAPRELELATEPADCAYRLSLTASDGRPLRPALEVGHPAPSASAMQSSYRRLHPSFMTSGDFWVTLEVSSFETQRGGPWSVPVLGAASQLESSLRHARDLDFLVLGLLLVMAFHHLCMFALRRSERGPLWLALIALSVAIRVVITGRFVDDPDATIWWSWLAKLEYLTFFGSVPLFVLFMRAVFPAYASRRFVRFGVLVPTAFVAVVLLTPTSVYTETLIAFQMLSMGVIIWIIAFLTSAARRERDIRPILTLLGFATLGVTVLHDILHQRGLVQSGFTAHLGLVGFILFQSLLLAVDYQRARQQAELYGRKMQTQAQEMAGLNEELRRQIGNRSHQLAHSLALLAGAEQDRADLVSGTVMAERYRIEELLGKGGMGAVYAAVRLVDGKEIALKVIAPGASASTLARFAREAEAASTISHPNVVSILDIDVTNDLRLFIIMERVHGATLEAKRDRFGDVAWAMPLIEQLARALAAIHAAHVVHRDLKPGNILLADDGVLKVADFGIAALRSADWVSTDETTDTLSDKPSAREKPASTPAPSPLLTQTGTVLGSPQYMAPESAGGARYTTAQSDMFSFGLIAYEMLTNRRAFEQPLALAGAAMRPPELAALCPSAPPAVAAVIDRCLQLDPAARPNAAELLAALEPLRISARRR